MSQATPVAAPARAGSAPAGVRSLPIVRRTLTDTWRSTVGWAVGLSAVLLLYLPLYPSMSTPQLSELLDSMPPQLIQTLGYDQITSGAGYTQATFFGLMGFVLLTIAGVSWGSTAIAGAEESGKLELTLAHGVSRGQYAVESALAAVVRLVALAVYTGLLIALLNHPSGLALEPGHLIAAEAALVGLTLLTTGAALAAGALTGRRLVATGAGATVAVLGYALNAVGNQSPDLAWLRGISPFDWAYGAAPLRDGVDWGGLGLLYGFSVLVIAAAVVGLRRRDVVG